MTDKFTFERGFYEGIKSLNDKQMLADFMIRLCEYALDEKDEPTDNIVVEALFSTVKPTIDTDIKRRNGGKKGGRPKEVKPLCREVKPPCKEVKPPKNLQNDAINRENEKREKNKEKESDIKKEKLNKEKKVKESLSCVKDKSTTEQSSDVQNEEPIEEQFNRFWKAYPKKVGKKVAKTSWKRIKPNKELMSQIMSALDKQKKSPQWTKDNGQFVPNPSTWLNQERWNDETDIAVANSVDEKPASFDIEEYKQTVMSSPIVYKRNY